MTEHTENCGLREFLKTLSSIEQKEVASYAENALVNIGIEHTASNSDPNPTPNPKRLTFDSSRRILLPILIIDGNETRLTLTLTD